MQANEGENKTERPMWAEKGGLDFEGRARWDAWTANKGMASDKAKLLFVKVGTCSSCFGTAVTDAGAAITAMQGSVVMLAGAAMLGSSSSGSCSPVLLRRPSKQHRCLRYCRRTTKLYRRPSTRTTDDTMSSTWCESVAIARGRACVACIQSTPDAITPCGCSYSKGHNQLARIDEAQAGLIQPVLYWPMC